MREAIAPRPGFAWPVYVGALLAILVFPFVWLYHKVTGR